MSDKIDKIAAAIFDAMELKQLAGSSILLSDVRAAVAAYVDIPMNGPREADRLLKAEFLRGRAVEAEYWEKHSVPIVPDVSKLAEARNEGYALGYQAAREERRKENTPSAGYSFSYIGYTECDRGMKEFDNVRLAQDKLDIAAHAQKESCDLAFIKGKAIALALALAKAEQGRIEGEMTDFDIERFEDIISRHARHMLDWLKGSERTGVPVCKRDIESCLQSLVQEGVGLGVTWERQSARKRENDAMQLTKHG